MSNRKWEWYSEIHKQDLDEYGGEAEIQLWPNTDSDESIYLEISIVADPDAANIDYEPAGPATYVPYGSQSVLYDDGSAILNSVDASKAVSLEACTIYNGPINNPNTKELSKQEAAVFLNCNIDDLIIAIEEIIEELLTDVRYYVEEKVEQDFYSADNWYNMEWQ